MQSSSYAGAIIYVYIYIYIYIYNAGVAAYSFSVVAYLILALLGFLSTYFGTFVFVY